MKRLAGIAFGLSLLMPTLQYEANLFERVAEGLGTGEQLSMRELTPPFDLSGVLETVTGALRSR